MQLAHIGGVLCTAISFDIQPLFEGKFRATHGTPLWSGWFGLTNTTNPLLAIQDVSAYDETRREVLDDSIFNDGFSFWNLQENQTSVTYVADSRIFHLNGSDWGAPVVPSPSYDDDRVCQYARHAIRQIFWWEGNPRDRCRSFLPGGSSSSAKRNRDNEGTSSAKLGGWGGVGRSATIVILQYGRCWSNHGRLRMISEMGWALRRQHNKVEGRLLPPARQTRDNFLTPTFRTYM